MICQAWDLTKPLIILSKIIRFMTKKNNLGIQFDWWVVQEEKNWVFATNSNL